MDRKTFLKKTAGALLLAAPAYAILSCTSDDSNNNNNNPPIGGMGDCSANGATATDITANHGHSLTVSAADVNAGVDKTYSIQGSGDHAHDVTVTAADFASLAADLQVSFLSTTASGHSHSVTVTCA